MFKNYTTTPTLPFKQQQKTAQSHFSAILSQNHPLILKPTQDIFQTLLSVHSWFAGIVNLLNA
jgi:hypothetical protein